MPRNKIPDLVEGRILELLQQGRPLRQIVKVLKSGGISVALSTVSNVKRKIGLQRNSTTKIKIVRKCPARTSSIVQQVLKKIDVEDPPTQRMIAKSLHISQSTVSKIIKNSGFVLRKKRKVQKLTTANVEKRRQRARRLYLQLANGRYRNFITTDESWFYLRDRNSVVFFTLYGTARSGPYAALCGTRSFEKFSHCAVRRVGSRALRCAALRAACAVEACVSHKKLRLCKFPFMFTATSVVY